VDHSAHANKAVATI
jgi:hypothetical protein